jgi:uncharacterized membrane protein YoaK (UPF0700 family)
MTGKVVFLGFALAGVGGSQLWPAFSRCWLSPSARRWAAGGPQAERCTAGTYWLPPRRPGVVLVASVIANTAGVAGSTARLMLIGLLALAMGGQNAVVRRLAADLTTTVLTLTVTRLVADTTSQSVCGRRLISVLAMLGGALTGGVLLRWVALAAPLWLAAVLIVACAAGAYAATRRPQSQTWR